MKSIHRYLQIFIFLLILVHNTYTVPAFSTPPPEQGNNSEEIADFFESEISTSEAALIFERMVTEYEGVNELAEVINLMEHGRIVDIFELMDANITAYLIFALDPSTSAAILSLMNVSVATNIIEEMVIDSEKTLEVVTAWIEAGRVEELGTVFEYLPDEPLAKIWIGMTVEDRSSVFHHLSDDVIFDLPVVDSRYPLVVVHLKGALSTDQQMDAVADDLVHVEWRIVFNGLTDKDLGEASMLIMVQGDSSLDYTEAELRAVKDWLVKGGKTIWVAADSDYGTDSLRQPTANTALEHIGSVLRIESASAEDPVSNGGAPYRVLAVSDNVDPEMTFLVSGVERGLFHGPGIVVGYMNGRYIKLEDTTPENVYVIMTTSEHGVVVDSNEPIPEVHMAGDEGFLPVMAVELDYSKKNVIIATGDAPFGQYMGLYMPEVPREDRYGQDVNPQQGGRLFENIIDYVTQYSEMLIESKNNINALDAEVSGLEVDISELESEKAALQGEVSSLESDVSGLESDVSGLERQVSTLESDLASVRSSQGSWYMYAVAALIIGWVVGYLVGPMLKKQ